MDLDLKHLKMVRAVAWEGTASGAARMLSVTPSAVSHHLTGLERRLGVRIFHREGRVMRPTAAGMKILQTAGAVLPSVEALEAELHRVSSGRTTLLRIGVQCCNEYARLHGSIRDYSVHHPSVEVQVSALDAESPATELLERRIEAAATYLLPPGPFRADPLWSEELVLLTSADHRLAEKEFIEGRDLAGEHLLLFRSGPDHDLLCRRVLLPEGVPPRRVSEIPIIEGLIASVVAGAGVTVLPRSQAGTDLQRGGLRAVRILPGGLHREWALVTLRDIHARELAHISNLAKQIMLSRPSANR